MNAIDQFQALFAEDIFQALLLAEIDEDKAAALTLKIYQRIQRNWGGCEVYIPTGNILEKMDRNNRIRMRFNGSNHDDLAREFGLHRRSIERILKK
jgi:Mor family transcriptional regulator